MIVIQCQSCYALMGEDAVEDFDCDQCPDCGAYTSFQECETVTESDLADLSDDGGDWWACPSCESANCNNDQCDECGAPRGDA